MVMLNIEGALRGKEEGLRVATPPWLLWREDRR